MPAACAKYSAAKWVELPTPTEPNGTSPGLALAAATRSLSRLVGPIGRGDHHIGHGTDHAHRRPGSSAGRRAASCRSPGWRHSRPTAPAGSDRWARQPPPPIVPIRPPAPGWLSTSTFCFQVLPSVWATMRAAVSAPDPAVNGTTSFTGALGKPCATTPALLRARIAMLTCLASRFMGWASVGSVADAVALARARRRAGRRWLQAGLVPVGIGRGGLGDEAGRLDRARRRRTRPSQTRRR